MTNLRYSIFVWVLMCSWAMPAEPTADERVKAALVGTRVPGVEKAELERPYEDHLQQEIPFGLRSYYLAPWRAYMDTWPTQRLLDTLGCCINGSDAKNIDAVAQLLAEAGIKRTRFECSWGGFEYDDPSKMTKAREQEFRVQLSALKKHGIRPMILLNAHHGWPCPVKQLRVKLLEDAPAGAREIVVDQTSDVIIGRTGLRGQDQQNAFPLIIAVDKATGRCTLSAPLNKDLKAGNIPLSTLKYPPFGGAVFVDGKTNPDAMAASDGWMIYARAVGEFAREIMAERDAEGKIVDCGFDIEVWNEYSFGSRYLDEKNYYTPPRRFASPIAYRNHGRVKTGHEIVLPMTVDLFADPVNGFPGVAVHSGFSNQRPWDNGAGMWPGQAGINKHPYPGIKPGDWSGKGGFLCRSTETERGWHRYILDAQGSNDGIALKKREGDRQIEDRSYYTPPHVVNMPEFNLFGYKTEFIIRDIQPFPSPDISYVKDHFRYSNPGTGRYSKMWFTEHNFGKQPWFDMLMEEHGLKRDNPRMIALANCIAAKADLRTYLMHGHKGVETVCLFSVRHHGDLSLNVIPETFYAQLERDNYVLTPQARALAGRQLEVIGRLAGLFKKYNGELDVTRAVKVNRVVEYQPRFVFKGDGTAAHPDVHHRDDLAVLPFQADDRTFIIGFYAVTRNMVHPWHPERDILDPARYDMPPQRFEIELGNICGEGAEISVYDPFTGETLSAELLAGRADALTAALDVVDRPRFLIVRETKNSALIRHPLLEANGSGAVLTFKTSAPVAPVVSWGVIPDRNSSSRELPEGLSHRVEIDELGVDCGVRITLQQSGLKTVWPRWGHDTAGMLRWSIPEENPVESDCGITLPPLTRGRNVNNLKPGGKLNWKKAAGGFIAEVEDSSARLSLKLMKVNDPREALPEGLADSDELSVTPVEWNGLAVYRFSVNLNPAAHPGVVNTHVEGGLVRHDEGWWVLRIDLPQSEWESKGAAYSMWDDILKETSF